MKNAYLKQYRFTIRTRTPVFIGSGEAAGKKEFVYDRDRNSMTFFDIPKLYTGLDAKGLLPAFQDYLLKDEEKTLGAFFESVHIRPAVYKKWSSYTADAGDRGLARHSTKDVQLFIKDPYGKPYVPGTSIKGMLRTVLAYAYYRDHENEADEMAKQINQAKKTDDPKKYLAAENKAISVRAFHRDLFQDENGNYDREDMINDSLRGLIVSDSAPLDVSDLCICEKIDLNTGGKETRIPVLRECLKPGTTFTFDLTIDTALCPRLTPESIEDAMSVFYDDYLEVFTANFRGAPQIPDSRQLFFLGGGSGYVSKTVAYAIYIDSDAPERIAKILEQVNKDQDNKNNKKKKGKKKKNVSPGVLKCTRYHDRLYQMGACCLMGYKNIAK